MLSKFSFSIINICMILSLCLFSGCNRNPPEETEIPIPSKSIPVKSFVFIESNARFDECSPIAKECRSRSGKGFGSSVLIAKSEQENLSVIMTAAHICSIAEEVMQPYQTSPGVFMFPKNVEVDFIFRDFHGEEYEVVSHVMSKEFDLCLMSLRGLIPFEPITIAQNDVKQGSKVFNLAAPRAIWNPKNILIFEGYYTGKILKNEKACYKLDCPLSVQDLSTYTISSLQGSSGSPVLNDDFELIGIIVSMPNTRMASHVSFGTTHNDIIGFVAEKLPWMLVDPELH